MKMPFPGMDPYREHPVLGESLHSRLIPIIAAQLQPFLDPRYVTSVEERVYIEGPHRRIPDVWVQKTPHNPQPLAAQSRDADTAVILEVEDLEVREARIEILDLYNNERLVTVIEVVSPTNKSPGAGRDSYQRKQREILESQCHLVEIDLLRQGEHVLAVPDWRVQELQPFDYLACVSRWPHRKRFELFPRCLRDHLPRVKTPLVAPDADAPLDLKAALEQAYWEARYMWRIRYDEPCVPPLTAADQQWAVECWLQFKAAHPEWFQPTPGNGSAAP